jgi:oligopeptide/dipeptide ABC transporter ATP-binding protein
MTSAAVVLEVRGLAKSYRTRRGAVQAFVGVDLHIERGETVALVGESGCGKTSLAKTIYRLQEADAGSIRLKGTDVTRLRRPAMRPHRRIMQMVFQDPFSSLNPRAPVGRIVEEPLIVHGLGSSAERRARVEDLLKQVGLGGDAVERYPHQFSGGQRQRIGIARALALDPELLICDEPVSALDISVQAQVLNLLTDAQEARGLAMLFISHDLSVVRHVADRVLVMYLGQIVETGPVDRVLEAPAHPYTRALLSAVPSGDPDAARAHRRIVLEGDPPSPFDVPVGCRFHTRCAHARDVCSATVPPLRSIAGSGRAVACHRVTGDDEQSFVRPWDAIPTMSGGAP